MTLILYQLGDFPIHNVAVGIDQKGLQVTRKRKWRNPVETLTDVGGVYSTLPATRDLPDDNTMTVKLNIIASENMGLDNVYNVLNSLGGRRNVPIIGFEIENQTSPIDEDCIDSLTWLKNFAVITDISVKYEYASEKNPWNLDYLEVSLTLFLGTQWEVLNPWVWEYRSWTDRIMNPFSESVGQQGLDTFFEHPSTFDKIKPDSYFFRWDAGLFDFNPTYWGLRFSQGRYGGEGSDWTSVGTHVVNADPLRWSGKVQSLYGFTGLSTSGTIAIDTKQATGFFQGDFESQSSTLDLAQLNTDLVAAGYTGVQADDVIITGFADPAPGFIIRDDVIITDVRPQWSYPGTYPGETGRAYNEVTVSLTGTGGQVAYLHEFGVY